MLRCLAVFTEDLYSLGVYRGVVFLRCSAISDGAHTVPLRGTRGCGGSRSLGCPRRGGEACAVLLPPSWRRTGCRGAFLPGLGVAWLPLVCFEPSLVNLFPVFCCFWRTAGMARGGANLRGPAARGCLRLQHGSLLPAVCSGAAG